MSDYPEEGRFEYGPADPVTGERWVKVSREMAHAHPKGRLGPALYAIVVYLVLVAGLRFYEFVSVGFAPALLLMSVLPMLGAVGLYLRVPFALVFVVLIFVMSVFGAITGIRFLGPWELLQLIGLGAAVVYLLIGERPNLIYRHRYKSFAKGPKS